jgi:hypothetical protein
VANAVVQTKSATVDNFGSTTTLSFNTTPTVGRAVTVLIAIFGPDVTSITDNQGNSYSLSVGAQHGSSSSTRNFIFRCANIATASGTFTVTLNTSGTGNYCLWSIVEESGALTVSPLDRTDTEEVANGTSVTPTTLATTQADEISYVAVGGSNAGNNPHGYTLPGDYTQIYKEDNASAHHAGIFGYKILSATAVQNPTVTWTGNETGLGVIATYKAAAAASSVFNPLSGRGGGAAQPLVN